MNHEHHHQVVIVGGGFGGLYAAQGLAKAPVRVTMVDKRNFHLFQPLLYQVASGTLSPGDIASPLREILAHQQNTEVFLEEVLDIDPEARVLTLRGGSLTYDTLILAPGSNKQYFGHDEWEKPAPGLKTIEDAVRIRQKILLALESAEKEPDPEKRLGWMTFVVVGGGPTGVEMAGALAELVHGTLRQNFRHFDTRAVQILMVEAAERILAAYPESLQQKAIERLEKLGVTILTGQTVQSIEAHQVVISQNNQQQIIPARTTLWTAGVKASPLGRLLAEKTGCPTDRGGRITVEADCSVSGHPEMFVIGDLANYAHTPDGKPLPGLAAVAMQQGKYVAKVIQCRLRGEATPTFKYRDKGSLAIIGRNAAVAQIGGIQLSGFPAWLVWLLVHIFYLIGFENKVMVTFQWAWNYLTRGRSACLITEQV
jgi:NADH dehydrogenase